MRHQDVCEIAIGLVVTKKYPPHAFHASELIPPYSDILKALQKNPNYSVEDIIQKHGLAPYQAAEQAAASLNGSAKSDWPGILHDSYTKAVLAKTFEHAAKKLYEGKDPDYLKISEQIQENTDDDIKGEILADVEEEFVPFQKCGYEPFDTHLGGIPTQGLIILGAKAKSGKTSLAIGKIAKGFVQTYPKKDVAIFSLEMINSELKYRAKELGVPLKLMKRMKAWDGMFSSSEIITLVSKEQINRISSGENELGMVIVDFADLMIMEEEMSEAVMASIYRNMAKLAKLLKIPVLLLSQLSRNGYVQEGLPKPYHLRYTSLAEALAWMIVMLYNPSTDWSDLSKIPLPKEPGYGYLLVWACRGGFKKHDGPGAIQVEWDGKTGWGDKATGWQPLVKTS